MVTEVAIVGGTRPREMVKKALDLIHVEKVISPKDRILLKPNYVFAMEPKTGVTTDPRVVEEVLIYFLEREVPKRNIIIGEGGAGDTRQAFKTARVDAVASRYDIKLLDLNRDTRVQVNIPGSSALKEGFIAKTVLDWPTCLVSIPRLKVHHISLITLGMKNMMGALQPKSIMHSSIHEKICDLNTLIKPRLTVIDGIIGSEKDEVYGSPVEMNVIVAGLDVVATDAVGAAIMGIDPKKVKHLQLAEQKGIGISNLDKITVLGTPIDEVKRDFEIPPDLADRDVRLHI